MDADVGKVTQFLNELLHGNQDAEARLIPLVYSQLRKIAASYLRKENPGHSLQPTALVNEAYLRLTGNAALEWKSRAHFFAVAAQIMRNILVDHARGRNALKRGGPGKRQISLENALVYSDEESWQVLAVHEALEELTRFDPRQGRIVELRFFVGLNLRETAEVLGISTATVKREFSLARSWLYGKLTDRRGKTKANRGAC
ncbi:MAG TPA: sigma-70 family RNA polymerase sigma factor [Candidatus Saccharimonadales bacterium]|jgi:RNA polymerase sigma factor (TIGR02999 family)|nr:sigma-70 family RNA polymerase sigma factor [Candidatus Saccharimonadales bacterium]